jgi:hypothetical protein
MPCQRVPAHRLVEREVAALLRVDARAREDDDGEEKNGEPLHAARRTHWR